MRERGKPRASDEEHRIDRDDRSFKKKEGRFPPPSDRSVRRRVDDVRGKSTLGPRRASSRHAVRGALTIDPSIDRSIDRWSREPIPRAPPPFSTIRPDEKNSRRAHAPCFPWNRETNPRERQRCASPASSSETSFQSVTPIVRPSVHPSVQVVVVVVSLVAYPPVIHQRPGMESIERAIALRARTARAPRDLLRPETAA